LENLALHVLQVERDLEHRSVTQVAFGIELFDEFFERRFLVRVCAETGFFYGLDQVAEARVLVYLRAKHECVDEKADEVFGLSACASGDRRADHDVSLMRVAIEQSV